MKVSNGVCDDWCLQSRSVCGDFFILVASSLSQNHYDTNLLVSFSNELSGLIKINTYIEAS